MRTLKELVDEYVAVRQERMNLEQRAEDLKNGKELELKTAIIGEMTASGVKTVNFGSHRVTARDTYHYEIRDVNALLTTQVREFVRAHNEGRPLVDSLLLQSRIHKGNLEALMGFVADDGRLDAMGVARSARTDLSLTRNRSKNTEEN